MIDPVSAAAIAAGFANPVSQTGQTNPVDNAGVVTTVFAGGPPASILLGILLGVLCPVHDKALANVEPTHDLVF